MASGTEIILIPFSWLNVNTQLAIAPQRKFDNFRILSFSRAAGSRLICIATPDIWFFTIFFPNFIYSRILFVLFCQFGRQPDWTIREKKNRLIVSCIVSRNVNKMRIQMQVINGNEFGTNERAAPPGKKIAHKRERDLPMNIKLSNRKNCAGETILSLFDVRTRSACM